MVLRRHRGSVPSQHALWEEVARRLRDLDPPQLAGPGRMRSFLAVSAGVEVDVRYARRDSRKPLLSCPVCFGPVRPRQNETLWGDSVIVGYRCTRCTFWTPLRRRVPAQYTFRAAFHPGTLVRTDRD